MTNIFYDPHNQQPIKFFLQKNLPREEITQLEQLIVDNGGRVQPKIPFQGYILIDPESREGLRLKTCWMGPENPQRYFVPYTFIRECVAAKKLLPQVFRKEDGSCRKFYIHTSVNNEDVLRRVSSRIQHSGGELVIAKDDAEIIIADERWDGFEALSIYHAGDEQSKAVEGIPWVKRSVGLGELHFSVAKKKNVGGRITGSKRTEFTQVDDNNLARYIASKIPRPEMRGRTGNNLYKELCNAPELYPWAARHPWQSWRERYRNNIDRFNNLIATFIEYDSDAEQPGTKCESEHERGQNNVSSQTKAGSHKETSPNKGSEASKEDDDNQWPIKVGTLGPPTWANPGKRQRSVEEQETTEESSKRAKVTETEAVPDPLNARSPNAGEQTPTMNNESQERRLCDRRGTTLSSDTEDESHILGQETLAFLETNRRLVNEVLTFEKDFKPALAKVATRYCFLQDEVEGTFQELGQDLQATEQHFKEIREYIVRKRAHEIKDAFRG